MQDHGPSVSVHFVCAFVCARCLCPLVASIASIRDDSIGLLLMPMMPSGYASKLSFKAQSGSQHAGAQEHGSELSASRGHRAARQLGSGLVDSIGLLLMPMMPSGYVSPKHLSKLRFKAQFQSSQRKSFKAHSGSLSSMVDSIGLLLMPIRFKHTHVSKLKAGLLLMPIRFKAQS